MDIGAVRVEFTNPNVQTPTNFQKVLWEVPTTKYVTALVRP